MVKAMWEALSNEKCTDEARAQLSDAVRKYLYDTAIKASPLAAEYNLLVIFDETMMVKSDADNIYGAVKAFSEQKPLLLTLYSTGGHAAAAYLLGKLCREFCNGSFIVSVPRYAKSAATLLACAADEIHMGSLSELGPIDPQINELPALGLKSSIEHIAELVKRFPESAEMFAKYLHASLPLIDLGYYERVVVSNTHYAERLLQPHAGNLAMPPAELAEKLVYGFKDHSFVIDKVEAQAIFGPKCVKCGTPQYEIGNALYEGLKWIEELAGYLDHSFIFIGSVTGNSTYGGSFRRKQKKKKIS